MTAERDEFQMIAERASIHGTAESGITAVDHLVYVFNFDRLRMQGIYDFFIMVAKNLLEYVHRSIMKHKVAKRIPTPQDCGAGELMRQRRFFTYSHEYLFKP